ncbi:uncharacterized protein LOC135943525 [Cloeon dipterum]|uniref:uncharacterized protein LOC135943525 n=1 Tax=Cloeon dipterum TaxID=197152 RepID=UPI0032200AD6
MWLPTNDASPSLTERCLAVSISKNSSNQGLVRRNCDESLPFICQYSVDCPQLCNRNDSLFDSSGNLKDKKCYGIWLDIGNYTYLLGNKPMAWLDSYLKCCALGMEALNIDSAAEQLGLTSLAGANKGNWTANFNYWTSGTWNGAPVKQWAWCKPNGPTVFAKGLVWEPSQPDNKGGNESCVHFRFTLNSTGTILTDRNCTNKYIFACKSALKTTPKPCVASCPINSCERNSNWTVARNSCCEIGLTLASMESAGKSSCFSRIVTSKFAPAIYGDYWLSGTDLGCDSNFRWCTLSRDFVHPELTWKEGHPKPGLDCVYLEVRSGSMLLATDDCGENKNFLCEVRKKATFKRAMQTECAETWDITVDQIDMLMNVSAYLTATISLNLKCFLKCVGVEIGMFGVGGLDAIATLRQIELVSQEDPVKLETGFVAYDQCSGISSDDECGIADETFKCGQEKAPDLVSKIIANNFDNNTMLYPPTPCVPVHRACWISNSTPCVKNQTLIDLLNETGTYKSGTFKKVGNRTFYSTEDSTAPTPYEAYTRCCELGMHVIEPQSLAESKFILSSVTGVRYHMMVGETEFINQTHEVWCRSRTVLANDMFDPQTRYQCKPSLLRLDVHQATFLVDSLFVIDNKTNARTEVTGEVYPAVASKVVSDVERIVCEKL